MYHYSEGDVPRGPVPREDLRGRITPRTLVWRSGMDEWRPAGELPELADLLVPAAVPLANLEPYPTPTVPTPEEQRDWREKWEREADEAEAAEVAAARAAPFDEAEAAGHLRPAPPPQPIPPPLAAAPFRFDPAPPAGAGTVNYAQPGTEGHGPAPGMAVASLVLGLIAVVGLCVWPVSIVLSILAVVFGFVARSQGARAGRPGAGLATAGIVLGFVPLGLVAAALLFFVAVGIYGAMNAPGPPPMPPPTVAPPATVPAMPPPTPRQPTTFRVR